MTFSSQIRALHPDFNGGDTSRIEEFTALVKAHRAATTFCQCGCGELLAPVTRKHFPHRKFFSFVCSLRYRHKIKPRRKLAVLAVLFFALIHLPLFASNVDLMWDASPTPGITNYVLYASTNALSATNLPTATVRLNVGTNLTAKVENIKAGQWSFAVTAMLEGSAGEINILYHQ